MLVMIVHWFREETFDRIVPGQKLDEWKWNRDSGAALWTLVRGAVVDD